MRFTKISLFFLILMSCTLLQAQKDTLAGKNYKELSKVLNNYVKDTTTALNILKYYINKAKTEKVLEREFEGRLSIASIYYSNEYFEKSAEALDKVINFRNDNKIYSQATRTYGLAMVAYMRAGLLEKAYIATDSVLAIAEKTNDANLKSSVNSIVDFLDGIGGNYEKLIKNTKIKIEAIRSQDNLSAEDKINQIRANELLIADSYIKSKQPDSGIYYLKNIIKSPLALTDSCITKFSYQKLAEAEVLNKRYDEALKNIKISKNYCQPTTKTDSLILGIIYGKMYYGQQKFDEAIVALETTLNTYFINENQEAYTEDIYKILANSYIELGDYQKANSYFKKYVRSTEKFSRVKDTIKANIREREFAKFREELLLLESQKEEKQSNFNYLLLGGSIIILILLFILLKFYRNKKANEIKFEILLDKIKSAEKPEQIIDTKDIVLEETNTTDVSEEVTTQILDGLKKLEHKEYFLNQECNSYNVAKKIGTNTSYLSKVINSHYEKNFNTYINDLRINYAIVRLKNDVIFRSYSIQSIAEEIGYKSADSFTKYFKKDTGLNPSFYIKEIKNIA